MTNPKKISQTKSKSASRRTKIKKNHLIILLGSLVVILALTLSLFWFLKIGQPKAPVKFSSSKKLSFTPGESFSLTVSPTNNLAALVYRLEVVFDPNFLSAEEIIPGDFFKNPAILRNKIDNQTGRIDFSAGITPQEMTESGEPISQKQLVTFTFIVKPQKKEQKNLKTTVSLGEKTIIISQESQLKDLHKTVKPAAITIKLQNKTTNN